MRRRSRTHIAGSRQLRRRHAGPFHCCPSRRHRHPVRCPQKPPAHMRMCCPPSCAVPARVCPCRRQRGLPCWRAAQPGSSCCKTKALMSQNELIRSARGSAGGAVAGGSDVSGVAAAGRSAAAGPAAPVNRPACITRRLNSSMPPRAASGSGMAQQCHGAANTAAAWSWPHSQPPRSQVLLQGKRQLWSLQVLCVP